MQPRYSGINQAIHWTTAALMFAILPIAWAMISLPEKAPQFEFLITWHKTLGILVLLITAFRLVWRFIDKPPPLPGYVGRLDRLVAYSTYVLFYVVLFGMPLSGYLWSTAQGYPTLLFGVIPLPMLAPKNDALAKLAGTIHVTEQWLVYALILLHISGVAVHLVWGRDGILGRMLPPYSGEPSPAVEGKKGV